ncbi:TlyA family RNA methyltransferase [Cellulomonas endophytica]|uniref:TlyA family RNA methyltransferase n=1 Tax=Cellulomonas endophytica TaxID=2494735 RepID=UPI0023EA5888|nr:TlyA family RNA methyltransferase [Cellulomonas endophytica]
MSAVVDVPVDVPLDAPFEAARLDAELVRRGLARSRRQAAELVGAGRVHLDGVPVQRPSTRVRDGQTLHVETDPSDPGWASRAAHKLVGALDALAPAGLAVAGRTCLDVGASTGGFTDVLLRRGAGRVVALDVGHGQLLDRLRTDPRVDVREGVNARDLRPGDVPAPDLVVGDVSFISLALLVGPLAALATPGTDLLLLVKPQFEVGRERLGAGGVVRDPALRLDAVRAVVRAAADAGLALRDVVPSPLPGPSGNVELFVWLRPAGPGAAGAAPAPEDVEALLARHPSPTAAAAAPGGRPAARRGADGDGAGEAL